MVVLITPLSFFVAAFIAKRTFTMFRLQSETRGEQTSLIDEMIGNQRVVPVSYTHLDVYKRQSVSGLRLTEKRFTAPMYGENTGKAPPRWWKASSPTESRRNLPPMISAIRCV